MPESASTYIKASRRRADLLTRATRAGGMLVLIAASHLLFAAESFSQDDTGFAVAPEPDRSAQFDGRPTPLGSRLRRAIQRAALPPEAHRTIESLNVRDADLRDVLRAIAAQYDVNLAVDNDIEHRVTVRLSNLSVIDALVFLCEEYGLLLEQRGAVLGIRRPEEAAPQPRPVQITVRDSLLSLDLSGEDVQAVIRAISERGRINIMARQGVGGPISGFLQDVPLDTGLRTILESNGFSLHQRGAIYYVDQPGHHVEEARPRGSNTKLIRLRHIRSEGLVERLPEHIRQNGAFQMIKEQNGIVAIGSEDLIAETEAFLAQIDIPTPQILIEALVVDFEETDLLQVGVSFGRDGQVGPYGGYSFGAGDEQRGGYGWEGNADRTRKMFGFWSDLFGLGSIGRLPSDFYLQLQALVHEGKAEVRSRPQIATLSGHTASISVGTTQYYILKSVVGYPIPGQPAGGEVEHFERVEANVSLQITPWVTASGEVTAEIRPEFATPVGMLDPRVPPTINNRVVDTTVRLKDGETVIIGGLIQESQSVGYNKIPVLGSIPVLGQLFRNRRHENRKSELVIFITPHVFYGDGQDEAKWNMLKEESDLSRIAFRDRARPSQADTLDSPRTHRSSSETDR